jgi:quinol monooxygenase YgiN
VTHTGLRYDHAVPDPEPEVPVIFICLKAEIRPDKRDEWLAGIARYTADVRAEPGNVSFDCFESLDTPNQFVIVEAFQDSDAGSAHVATDHAKNFFEFFPTVITEVPKIVYQEIDGWSEMAEVKPTG